MAVRRIDWPIRIVAASSGFTFALMFALLVLVGDGPGSWCPLTVVSYQTLPVVVTHADRPPAPPMSVFEVRAFDKVLYTRSARPPEDFAFERRCVGAVPPSMVVGFGLGAGWVAGGWASRLVRRQGRSRTDSEG